MLKRKKTFAWALLMLFVLSLALSGAASAELLGKVQQSANQEALTQEVDTIGTNIVGFIRGIFGVLAVIFVIWAGFAAWGSSGDPQRIAQAKRIAAGFIVCLICVFAAEKIVGGVLGILGYQIQ
ncbi:MAG: hypothetical protein C4570_03650 [Ammonifex sp.]|jgi:type IV secretory pathway VirB2 component (pilin)|nr:MAG: hypothetical protein C4570_03650 [Ammonifex sp.]